MKILYRTAFALGHSPEPMKDIHSLAELALIEVDVGNAVLV